jgi:glycosyltransferase involved in cell wall biosynthesis
MPSFSLNLPINSVSFGQLSVALLRGIYGKKMEPPLFPIGGSIDLSSQEQDSVFFDWLAKCANLGADKHNRKDPTLKLWHLNGGLESFSKNHSLLTFYELDQPTPTELNIAKNLDKLIVTNKYTQEVFNSHDVKSETLKLPFDRYNFKKLEKQYFDDGRITFNLCGKFEKRKHHQKTIRAWVKRFGNNQKYFLQCALYNNFLSEEQNKQSFANSLEGTNYNNVHFLGFMGKNKVYNDYLNSADIILAMSGAEGWGLPEFHSVALGKHAVVLNCTGYKEWADENNSILIEPRGKIDSADGIFFKRGDQFNQGKIYDFNEDDFISGCEEAIKRTESSRINEEGVKIQSSFTIEKTVDSLLNMIE